MYRHASSANFRIVWFHAYSHRQLESKSFQIQILDVKCFRINLHYLNRIKNNAGGL